MTARFASHKQLAKVHDRNLQQIVDAVKDDLEIQMLVLNYLADVQADREGGEKPKRSKSKGSLPDPPEITTDDDTPVFDIPSSAELSGKMMKLTNWKKQLIVELLAYVEPKKFSLALRKVDSVNLARQLFCMGFGVEAFDPSKSDRITTRNKKLAFDRLRSLYIGNGRLLREVELQDGFVDFSTHGHYSIETLNCKSAMEVRVTDKRQRKVAVVPSEMMTNLTTSYASKDIKSNYSYADAYIVLPDGSSLALGNLFPKVRRVLSKKLSDELDALAHDGKAQQVHAGQQKEANKGVASGTSGRQCAEMHQGHKTGANLPPTQPRKRAAESDASEGDNGASNKRCSPEKVGKLETDKAPSLDSREPPSPASDAASQEGN